MVRYANRTTVNNGAIEATSVQHIDRMTELDQWTPTTGYFPQIFFKRPLWDIIVIMLMTGGTSVTITGVILFFRWMKRELVHGVRVVRKPISKAERQWP